MHDPLIVVNIFEQRLYLIQGRKIVKQYPVSTSKYGIGNQVGSKKTPIGKHCIASKLGGHARLGEALVSRRRTRHIVPPNTSQGDCITTRILRLRGLERGVNQGKGIDSYERCIYIHGTPEERLIGSSASHGCIRMNNRDIAELFPRVKRGTIVYLWRRGDISRMLDT